MPKTVRHTEIKWGRDAIAIDHDRLDIEWVHLPTQMLHAADDVSALEDELLQKKKNLKSRQSKYALLIRNDPKEYGIKAKTEKAIENAVNQQPKIQLLNDRVLDCMKKLSSAKDIVQCLTEKRRALEALVTLHATNWSSTPKDKHGGAKDLKKQRQYDRTH